MVFSVKQFTSKYYVGTPGQAVLVVGTERKARLIGIITQWRVILVMFRCLSDSYKKISDRRLKSIYWALADILVFPIMIWMRIGLLGRIEALFYLSPKDIVFEGV